MLDQIFFCPGPLFASGIGVETVGQYSKADLPIYGFVSYINSHRSSYLNIFFDPCCCRHVGRYLQ